MRIPFVFLVFMLLSANVVQAQTVKVIDESDLQTIADVFIFSASKSTLTNEQGRADLSVFEASDTLWFQHRSFATLKTSMSALKENKWQVGMKLDLVKVNEIVVSQNRWEQNKEEIPNKIESIKAKDVSFYNPQTTAELIGLSDQVFIQKSQMGGGSPMIRGFAANRVLLAIDGVRMNNAIYRSGNLQNVITLDPNVLDNSEIIFGPGSIIYGSDAIGGVMDFHTRKVKLSTSDDHYLRLNALTRFSSANMEKSGHLDFSYGKKDWGFLSSVSFSDFGDLRMGSKGDSFYERPVYVRVYPDRDTILQNKKANLQVGSGYSQMNLMQKFRFRPSEHFDLSYAFHYSRSTDVPRFDRLIEMKDDTPKYAEWYYGPSQWLMHQIAAQLTDSTPFFDQLRFSLSYQAYSESRHDRKLGSEQIRERYEYLDITTISIDADKKLPRNNEIFYGLEWATNRVNSLGISRDIYSGDLSPVSSRYPDGGTLYINSGLYTGLKKRVSSKLFFSSGIRANYVYLNSLFVSKQFFDFPFNEILVSNSAFNGSVGLAWHPEKTLQLNFNLSSGFRAPNLDDVGKVFDSEPGNVVVPNSDLAPEYAINGDLGIIKYFGDNARIEATGFYTYLFDAMVRRDYTFNGMDSIVYDGELSKVEAVVNADWAIVYGISTAINWNFFQRFNLKSSITATKGMESGGIPMRHVAPLFGATHLIYQASSLRADFYMRYNGTKRFESMAPSELGKTFIYPPDTNGNLYSPGWYTLNMSLAYQVNSFVQVNLSIENILDKRYRMYSSGISAPGRNLILTVRTTI